MILEGVKWTGMFGILVENSIFEASKKWRKELRTCYNCRKVGHLSKDCRGLRRDKDSGSSPKSKGSDTAASALASEPSVNTEGKTKTAAAVTEIDSDSDWAATVTELTTSHRCQPS